MIPIPLEQLFLQAKTAVKNNQFWQAAELYTDVLANTSPKSTDPEIIEMRLTALRERGHLLGLLGEQVAALHAYEQYHLEAGSGIQAVMALVAIGGQCRRIGQYERALQVYQQAAELADSLDYVAGRAQALAGVGGVYVLLGRIEEAMVQLNQATSLFEALNDVPGQVQSLNEKGVAFGTSGQLDKAIAVFKISLKLAEQMNRQDRYVITLNNLGECYRLLYDIEQALPCHEEALQKAEAARLRFVEADICRNLGLDYRELGRMDEALAYLRRALAVSEEIEHLDTQLYTLFGLAVTEVRTGDVDGALIHAHQLREMAINSDSRGHLARSLYALGLVAQAQSDPNTAEEVWQQALYLAHETERRMLLWQLHASLAEVARNESLAQVHYRIAGEIIHQIAEPIEDERLCQSFLTAVPVQTILAQSEAGG